MTARKPKHRSIDVYATAWRLPIIIWQFLFFVGPLLFMVAMSFFLVKNYRMVESFSTINWSKMLARGYVWDSYFLTLGLAGSSTVLATLIAFPAAYALVFKVSDNLCRWTIFLLIIPFFTSYLVRIFSWYVVLAESGALNTLFSWIGLGPFTILNTMIGTLVGYMTLVLPLVVILQTFALAKVDKRLIEAAHNLGCKPFASVFRVVIPLAKPGLIIAAVFCFILSFGDFVSPYYLGGSKPPTLSILIIDTTKSGQQWPRAAVVAIMMMVTLFTVAFAAVAAAYRKQGRT